MQSIRDAAILLVMILVVASDEPPAAHPAAPVVDTASPLPAMRWTAPPPARDGQALDSEGEEGQDQAIPMEAGRDQQLLACLQHYPTDPEWARESCS
jgi:hypothetical protein